MSPGDEDEGEDEGNDHEEVADESCAWPPFVWVSALEVVCE